MYESGIAENACPNCGECYFEVIKIEGTAIDCRCLSCGKTYRFKEHLHEELCQM